jgi:hypothetical protein
LVAAKLFRGVVWVGLFVVLEALALAHLVPAASKIICVISGMYSRATQEQFVKSKLCQDDPKLYELFQRATTPRATEADRRAFRKKLGATDVSEAVQTFMTDACRPLIHGVIKALNKSMLPMGELIITGGEAFNHYLPKNDRVVTTDIDTKFCPLFADSKETIITPMQYKVYFEALQITKILMWDRLGRLAQQSNRAFNQRIRSLARTSIGKLLQIKPVKDPLLRRYTLIPKMKQGSKMRVIEGDVLIDVELFAIDAKVKYLGRAHKMGGMLDVAFMRPMEIGYDVIFSSKVTRDGLKVAGKDFLLTDLFMMQTLKLRPQKKEKDQKRMYLFATKVLNMKVSPRASMKSIFEKARPRIHHKWPTVYRPVLYDRDKLLRQALRVKMNRYPRVPVFSKLGKCTSDVRKKGYKETKSDYVFIEETKRWTKSWTGMKMGPTDSGVNMDWYIRNMAKYRGPSVTNATSSSASAWKWGTARRRRPGSCKQTLYGYNPARNAAIPKKLIQKATQL